MEEEIEGSGRWKGRLTDKPYIKTKVECPNCGHKWATVHEPDKTIYLPPTSYPRHVVGCVCLKCGSIVFLSGAFALKSMTRPEWQQAVRLKPECMDILHHMR